MINFDALPKERSNKFPLIPKGTYKATILSAEMKQGKDPNKPPYLNIRWEVKDTNNKILGNVFDVLTESTTNLAQYKLSRFITALNLNLQSFELKDLTKIIIGKEAFVDIDIQSSEGYDDKNTVDALSGDIYKSTSTTTEFDAEDADAPSTAAPDTSVEY